MGRKGLIWERGKSRISENARGIPHSNGYPTTSQLARILSSGRRPNGMEDDDKISFCFPFIDDAVSASIRASFRRYDLGDTVRLVEMPPLTLSGGSSEIVFTIDIAHP